MPRKKEVREGQLGVAGNVSAFTILKDKGIEYNPSSISLSTYDEMRFYPAINAALNLVSYPIQSVDWYMKCDDKRIEKEMDEDFRSFVPELLRDITLAFRFGYTPFEKIFSQKDGRYIYDKLLALNPNNTKPLIDPKSGNFTGIVQQVNQKETVFSSEYSFVYTHQKEYGNNYGIPRLRAAYTPWFIARYVVQWMGTFLEKYGQPQLVGYTMAGKTKFQGNEIDNVDYMVKMLKSLQSSSVAAFPKSSKKKDELDHYVEILESGRTGADYKSILEFLNGEMFMGVAAPQLAFSGGEKGSYALGDVQMDTFWMGIDGLLLDMSVQIDKYLVNPLVELNYGNKWVNKVHWIYQPLSKNDKKLVKDIMLALVQQGRADIAIDFLKEALGLPIDIKAAPAEVVKQTNITPTETTKEVGAVAKVEKVAKPLFGLSRKPNDIEKHIDFGKIKKRYDANEAEILSATREILNKQKENLMINIEKAIKAKDPSMLMGFGVSRKVEYENKIAELSKRIFEEGMADVKAEMKLGNIKLPSEAKSWVIARAKSIAEKHMADLKFDVIGAALTGMSKDLSEKEILNNSLVAFDNYASVELVDSSVMLNHKFYNEGREWIAEGAGIKQAEWSAVLDNNTCEYCESRDGMIINLSDPDFSEFAPGNAHENCRCIWIYIDGTELETTWKTPSQRDQKQFYMCRGQHG